MSALPSLTDPVVAVRALHFGACVMVAGLVLFDVFIAAPALRKANPNAPVVARLHAQSAWLAWGSLAVAVISGAASLVFTAMSMSGASAAADVLAPGLLWTVLTQTTFGNAWLLRFVVACALAAVFVPFLRARGSRPAWLNAATVLLAATLVGSLAWAGHAVGATGVEGILHPAADVLHLVAAAAWVGALIPLALLLHGAARDSSALAITPTATLRFSTLGIVSVAAILITGSINTWYLAGSIAALRDTDYGQLLLIKIALFLGMVAVAAVNRLRLTPRIAQAAAPAARQAVQGLRRNTLIEAAAGALIIVIVAVLGTLPPASHAAHQHPEYGALPADAAFVHIHGDQGMAEVMIEPGRVGTASATIHLWNDDDEPLEAKEVTLTLSAAGVGSKPTAARALQGADGAWHVDHIELTQPGNWTAAVDATLGTGSHLSLAAPIVIEAKE